MKLDNLSYIHLNDTVSALRPGWYRIVWVVGSQNDVAVLRCPHAPDESKPWKLREELSPPLLVEKTFLYDLVSRSKASIARDQEAASRSRTIFRANCTNEELQKQKLLEDFNENSLRTILLIKGWGGEMRRLSKKYSLSINTVKRLVLKFLLTGRNFEEAVQRKPRTKGLSRSVKAKLGRKRDKFKAGLTEEQGVNSADQEKLVQAYIEARGSRRGTVAAQHRDFYANFASKGTCFDENGIPQIIRFPEHERIEVNAFRALLKKLDYEEYVTRNESVQAVRNKQIVIIGSARKNSPFPGHTYLIDSTIADIYLVSAYHRWRVIGRPVIYIVIDVATSYILAIYVTLWGPNFSEARNAIFMALSDKKAYLRYLDLEQYEDYFRKGVRPNFLLFDRAELLSKNGEQLALKLQFSCSVTPAFKPIWKALVERTFGVLNGDAIHKQPGAVVRAKVRGEDDYRQQAIFTLGEFRRLMAIAQIRWNISKRMGKHLTPSMLADPGCTANPIWMWDWGIENLHGTPFYFPREQLISTTLETHTKPVRRTGFELDGMELTGEWMKSHPAIRLSEFNSSDALLAKSPEDPRLVHCRMPGEEAFRDLFLKNVPAKPSGFSGIWLPSREDDEHLTAIQKFANSDPGRTNVETNDELTTMEYQMKMEAQNATERSVASHSPTKSERTSDMKGARHVEDEHERTGVYQKNDFPADSEATVTEDGKSEVVTTLDWGRDVYDAVNAEIEGWGE